MVDQIFERFIDYQWIDTAGGVATMPRTTTATEAKTQFGAMIDWAVEHGDEIVIESRGQPKAVLISYTEFEVLQRLREAERRRQALAQLEALAERVAARNSDLTQPSAEELAERFTREVIGDIVGAGRATHQAG
jgi:prevent-host-death family protein